MEHSVQTTSGGKEYRLSGRLTFADYSGFKSLIDQFQNSSGKRVVFEMSDVEFIDSAALGMILLARDVALSNGVTLSLKGAKGQVKRIMEVAKFGKLLN